MLTHNTHDFTVKTGIRAVWIREEWFTKRRKIMRKKRRAHLLARNKGLVLSFRMLIVSFAVPLPVIVLFWQDYGLSLSDVALLQLLFAVALTAFEVPSGYVADYFSRKATISVGSLLLFLGAVVYTQAGSFSGFLVAEMVLALGFSLISGADQALLYDSLKEIKRSGSYISAWSRITACEHVAAAVGTFLGGFIAVSGFRNAFYVTAGLFLLQFLLSLFIVEPKREKTVAEHGHLNEIIKVSREQVLHNSKVMWLFIFAALATGLLQPVLWWYQPYLLQAGVSVKYFGAVFVGFGLIAAFMSARAKRIEELLGLRGALMASFLLIGSSFLLLGSVFGVWSFAFIYLHQAARGLYPVLISAHVNHEIPSHHRATVMSLLSMAQRIAYIAVLMPSGWVADKYGVTSGFVLFGVVVLLLGVLWLRKMPQSVVAKSNV